MRRDDAEYVVDAFEQHLKPSQLLLLRLLGGCLSTFQLVGIHVVDPCAFQLMGIRFELRKLGFRFAEAARGWAGAAHELVKLSHGVLDLLQAFLELEQRIESFLAPLADLAMRGASTRNFHDGMTRLPLFCCLRLCSLAVLQSSSWRPRGARLRAVGRRC